jgi:L-fuculose-phosphate aldolase
MVSKDLENEYKIVSQALFQKDFLHIYHGSLSVRTNDDKFLINKRASIFSELNSTIEVHFAEDISWKESSIDTDIHSKVYQTIPEAKCITQIFPVNLVTYSLYYKKFKPVDYIGEFLIGELDIIHSVDYSHWKDQSDSIITHEFLSKDVVIIKGIGAFIYDRDLRSLARKASILENSAKILLKSKGI